MHKIIKKFFTIAGYIRGGGKCPFSGFKRGTEMFPQMQGLRESCTICRNGKNGI